MQENKSANLCFICVHLWLEKPHLKHNRLALGHHQNLFLDAMFASSGEQTLRRFVKRFESETKCPVMHRDQGVGTYLKKCLNRFLGIHVNFAACGRFVRANRKQRDIDPVAVADFLEAGKVSAVAAVKNSAAIRRDHKTAEIAMQIRQETGAPVVTGGERNLERPELDRLPIIELVHNMKPQIMDEISYAHRHNNRLIRRNSPQCAPVEVIEVGMRHKDKINRRQMMNFKAWLFQSLDHLEPFRPHWVNEDIDLVGLDEK